MNGVAATELNGVRSHVAHRLGICRGDSPGKPHRGSVHADAHKVGGLCVVVGVFGGCVLFLTALDISPFVVKTK